MNDHKLFCEDVLRYGAELDLVCETGGSVCPCTVKTGVFSPDWHRNHADETHCNGNGRINTETVTRIIKAYVFNYTMVKTFRQYAIVGNLCEKDIMIIGSVNADDGSFVDLGSLDDFTDYFEYRGCRYRLKQSDVLSSNDQVAQFAILRRI